MTYQRWLTCTLLVKNVYVLNCYLIQHHNYIYPSSCVVVGDIYYTVTCMVYLLLDRRHKVQSSYTIIIISSVFLQEEMSILSVTNAVCY